MSKNNFGLDLDIKDTFSFFRMATVTKRVLKQLFRDKRTFGMMIFMPIIIMIIFGFALSGEVKNVPIIVINNDQAIPVGPGVSVGIGNNLTSNLIHDDRVSVNLMTTSFQAAGKFVDNGTDSAVIYIPSNFSASFLAKVANPQVVLELKIYIDGTSPTIKASILGALQDSLQKSLGKQAVNFDQTQAFGNASFTGLDVAIPAVMALVLTFLILLVSLVTIVREKLYGTQMRLYSTPVTKLERLLGFVIALSFMGLIMVMAVILIGTLVFGATVKGNFYLLIASAFLYALTHVFLAVFLSNFTENELQAVQFGPLIAFPSMALSGMLVPINSLPFVAQVVSNFIPMTYGVNIFEGVMLKGFGFEQLWKDYLILSIFALIACILAFITVKDKMED